MLDHRSFDNHENVSFFHERKTGANVIIALHNTFLGPALGGVRMVNYETTDDVLDDVLRLSRGMTYKNAMANIPHGGGKAIIVGNPQLEKTPALFQFYADCINSFKGQFISGQDIGIVSEDVDLIQQHTEYTSCASTGGAGNPSPATAWGVLCGIKAAIRHKRGSCNLKNVVVAIQGVGNVGERLAEYVHSEGGKLVIADTHAGQCRKVREKFGARVVETEAIHAVDCDVFAPCSFGAVLNQYTITDIKASIVAGAANNQLAEKDDGEKLTLRGILYAPDYVINAGGVISIFHEGPDFDRKLMMEHVSSIDETLFKIFEISGNLGLSPNVVADNIAEKKFRAE